MTVLVVSKGKVGGREAYLCSALIGAGGCQSQGGHAHGTFDGYKMKRPDETGYKRFVFISGKTRTKPLDSDCVTVSYPAKVGL